MQRAEAGQKVPFLGLGHRHFLDLGRDLMKHCKIIADLEIAGCDEGPTTDLLEGVFELGQPIRRIDVDED